MECEPVPPAYEVQSYLHQYFLDTEYQLTGNWRMRRTVPGTCTYRHTTVDKRCYVDACPQCGHTVLVCWEGCLPRDMKARTHTHAGIVSLAELDSRHTSSEQSYW
jgi:hypothetical protein